MTQDDAIDQMTARYPMAEITPEEFERFVVELLESATTSVDDLVVTLHEKIAGVDGEYDFDSTVRFNVAGMEFLVIVEAKRHKNPIKRELVQALNAKLQSVGAQKAVMIATGRFQSGAVEYATTHGIALATVTEGRFTFEAKSMGTLPTLSREEASEQFDLPTYVGHAYTQGETPEIIQVTLLDSEHPEYVAEALLGVRS